MEFRLSEPDKVLQLVKILRDERVSEDLRVYLDGHLVYACYDDGRTQVMHLDNEESRGILRRFKEILSGPMLGAAG